MCTVVILNRAHPELPLVLAANRDERYSRPSAPPRIWPGPKPFVAPVDLSKGGSWLAVTGTGFVVAITNRHSADPTVQAPRSRGELVTGAVRAGSRSAARSLLATIDARDFGPFNLLYGDADGLEIAYGRTDESAVEIEPIPAGVHVLPNARLDSPDVPKVARIRARLASVATLEMEAVRLLLEEILRDRQLPELEEIPTPPEGLGLDRELMRQIDAVAIETPHYGTRSSSIISLTLGGVSELWWADGPPHHTPFTEQRQLLELLRRSTR